MPSLADGLVCPGPRKSPPGQTYLAGDYAFLNGARALQRRAANVLDIDSAAGAETPVLSTKGLYHATGESASRAFFACGHPVVVLLAGRSGGMVAQRCPTLDFVRSS